MRTILRKTATTSWATALAIRKQGGSGPYRKGAAIERLVKRAYEKDGCFVIRSPQSHSPIDLLVVYPSTGVQSPMVPNGEYAPVHMVQVKSKGYLRPAEREAVIQLANAHGATPVLAWATPSGPIYRRNLNGGYDLETLPNPGPANQADHQ